MKAQGTRPQAPGDSKEGFFRYAAGRGPCTAHDSTWVVIGLCLLFLTLLSWPNAVCAYSPEDCIQCHEESGQKSILQISVEDFKNSVHGTTFSCLDCHTDIQDESHQKKKGSGTVSCRQCHELENRHGLGARSDLRPECHSCHTRHRIMGKGDPTSSIYPEALKRTCASCHPAECGRAGYLAWFPSLQIVSHGKQDFSKPYDRGNCLGCHQGAGAHGEKKAINAQNCYKCHDSMAGYMHPKANLSEEPTLFGAAWVYQIFGAALLLGGGRFCIRKIMGKKRKPEK